jgi:hypothetical protein
MKASQKDMSSSAESRRKREQMQEDKELRQIMGASTSTPTTTTTTGTGVKSISLKPGFKPLSTTPGSAGGWKSVRLPPKKSEDTLHWGNNGEDDYDPAYPTPA